MTKKPFNTMPAMLLSLPGVLLFLVVISSLLLLYTGAPMFVNGLVSNTRVLIIGSGFLLTLVTLIATPIALFYIFSTAGNGPRRAGFVILNVLLLILAIAGLIGFGMAMSVLLFNPG